MIEIKNKSDCCGCGACSQVCPRQCIKMESDREGFLYPILDKEACISCSLCEKSCPILNIQRSEVLSRKCYIAYDMNEKVRLESSSGGVFSALSEAVIQKGGVVFGAAFDKNWFVHHVGVERQEDLRMLQGSKYLQSRSESCYQEAKALLEAGRPVLYSGTGCQIAGLKSYLKKDYEKLLTVDIICHGVPSPKLWKHYLTEQEQTFGAPVQSVFFRNKDTGWNNFSMSINFSNQKKYLKSFREDPYMRLFLKNICLRPACHDCKFKALYSQADITLGDCWGIEKTIPSIDDDKGISVVLINTDKGEEAFKQISDCLVYREAEYQNVYQPMMNTSVKPHLHRKQLFRALNMEEKTLKLCELLDLSLTEKALRKLKKSVLKFSIFHD